VYVAPEMLEHLFADSDGSSDDDENGGGGSGDRQAAVFKPASDVYALGMVLYALTTGKEPWEALLKKHPESAVIKVPQRVVVKKDRPPLKPADGAHPFIEERLRACWAHGPADRPAAAELRQQFERVLQSEAAAATAAAAQEEAYLCVICEDVQKSVLLLPCKHVCMCEGCAGGMRDCPICRAPISERITGVYITS
jgi:serine/threonine protein kinase